MSLGFDQVLEEELDVVNFRRAALRDGQVSRARQQAPQRQHEVQGRRGGGRAFLHDRAHLNPDYSRPDSKGERRSARFSSPNDLVGMSLSGGGIRSAAFSLGVLQGLDSISDHGEPHVLDAVDYLSTVSGGGYMGTSLVAAMMQEDYSFPFDSQLDYEETPETRHLRNYSNFLAPNGSFDLLVSAALVIRGVLVNAALLLPILLILAAISIQADPTLNDLKTPDLFGRSLAALHIPTPAWAGTFGGTVDLALLLASVLVLSSVWTSVTFVKGTLRARQALGTALAWCLVLLLLVTFSELQPYVLASMFGTDVIVSSNAASLPAGLAAVLAAIAKVVPELAPILVPALTVLMGFMQKLANMARANVGEEKWGGLIKRLTSLALIWSAAIVVPLLLWVAYIYLTYWGVRADTKAAFNPATPDWLIATANWVSAHVPAFVSGSIEPVAAAYLAIAALLGLLWILVGPNANSLHRLYRDRLSKAFLFERAKLHNGVASTDVDKWTFSTLKPFNVRENGQWEWQEGAAFAPFLLVNAAVNLEASRDLKERGRKADTFTFSPLHVGSGATGYARTVQMEKVVPDLGLGTAMATSGAAASANMGAQTVAILTFSLSVLNVRLGYWLANPARADDFRRWYQRRLAGVGGLYFMFETFGWLGSKSLNVYLTDGGHIENLGIYELLRRRCKVIIASDAEADPEMTFGSLIRLQVLARIDLGVRIDLPWEEIKDGACAVTGATLHGLRGRPGSHGPHVAIGRIRYSETESGVLIYIKASLSGDEPDYVLDYKRRNATFPHETTMDQFFDEEQFEMYRALGFHITRNFFTGRDGYAMVSDADQAWREQVLSALELLNVPAGMVAKIDTHG